MRRVSSAMLVEVDAAGAVDGDPQDAAGVLDVDQLGGTVRDQGRDEVADPLLGGHVAPPRRFGSDGRTRIPQTKGVGRAHASSPEGDRSSIASPARMPSVTTRTDRPDRFDGGRGVGTIRGAAATALRDR